MPVLRRLRGWAGVVLVALVLSLVVRSFLFTTFWIPSASMEPTLVGEDARHDRIAVNRLSYRLHDVRRGDIVVFHTPPGLRPTTVDGRPVKDLVKRVVGLPGETVALVHGKVTVDGRPLAEPYLADGTPTEVPLAPGCGATRWVVPEGQVLVMGDNRTDSIDGRCFGPIDEDAIVGRAFVRFWPLSHITWL